MVASAALVRAIARADVAQSAADEAWAEVRRLAEAAAMPSRQTISAGEAARITGRSSRTIRRDAKTFGFGELVGEEWRFDRQFILSQYPPK